MNAAGQTETTERSKQWTSLGGTALKKVQTALSIGEVMAVVLWDS